MDDEPGVKVTRLRRRLSIEAEAQSPAAPPTPTKKRGVRLAKPALELIDENVTEDVPKKTTRKSMARDVVEPAEEKAVTPSRRSARIRSNTSLVLETNTNVVDSPRARRAIRRNSHLGSDTETTTTPAKPTRRTRRDSTSSVENKAVTNPNEKLTVQVTEIIVEEPEKEIKNSKVAKNDKSPSTSLRKSPRLNKNDKKNIDETVKDINEEHETVGVNTQKNDEAATDEQSTTEKSSENSKDQTDSKLETEAPVKEDQALSSANLIKKIDSNLKKLSVLNKSTSAIEKVSSEKSNRKRTKSWTTVTSIQSIEGNIYDKNMNNDNLNNLGCASGDSLLNKNETHEIKSPNISTDKSTLNLNTSIGNKENLQYLNLLDVLDASETAKLLEKTPTKNIQSMVFIEDSDSNSGSIGKLTIDLKNDSEGQNSNGDDQCVPVVTQSKSKRSSPSESFTVEPMDIDETIPENVTINDFSDKTNSSVEENKISFESKRKSSISNENSMNISLNKSKRTSSISLQQESNNSKRKSSIGDSKEKNDSKAALNISDRYSDKSQRKSSTSIHNDNSDQLNENANNSKNKLSLSKVDSENEKRKLSLSSQYEDNDKINESENKSKRKSGSKGESENLEKTSNENKSTLVLSQLKDVSANELSNVSKSPNDTNNELSKSLNIPIKETDKKNPNNYLTSTPLQQKPLQKIAMQINTSIISRNAGSKNTSTVDKTTPKKVISNVINNSDSTDAESDDDSREKSKIIDDEAEEASESYESGDSRDVEERQYEEDHEIVQEGETLESSQEFSNDSDYEKDSFVVSSDEEDDDLLSGSGDDLSMSDKELKMTAKSKKKFDERKRKEQKKASKEMYEARHKLNESDKSAKPTKKNKRQRLESSALDSENEDEIQPKKNNRLRIDSSQDVSSNNSDTDASICIKKKKTKRLSASVCEENAVSNEKEITIFNQSIEKSDPLCAAVKQEPKTPQKDLNMSTVLITDNIEEVHVDGNVSVMKLNETSDPLQATLAHEDEESDSDISENIEIKENYDSVLENLNLFNNKPKKFKTQDTSLNLNKKTKDKVHEPIVDQLNLTQVKKSKKNKVRAIEESGTNEQKKVKEQKPSKTKDVSATTVDEGETSDSIDMRLLFPEDSNDSETNVLESKNDDKQDGESADHFIPLKRSEAKTNIRENIDEPDVSSSEPGVGFFFDTKGTYEDMDTSTQSSPKKNKKKHKQNVSIIDVQKETVTEIPELEESSVNVSLKSDKKKKNKSREFSQILDNTGEESNDGPIEVSVERGKHNKSDMAASEDLQVNVSVKSDKKKKKNKTLDGSQNVDDTAPEELQMNVSVISNNKKKNKSFDVSQTVEEPCVTPLEVSFQTSATPLNVSVKSDKRNKSLNGSQIVDNTGEGPVEVNLDVSCKSEKKKKSHDGSQIIDNTGEEPNEVNFDVSTNSEKKKKKKKKLHDGSQIIDNTGEGPNEVNLEVSLNSEKKKKKNKSHDGSQIIDNTGEGPNEVNLDVSLNSEKKKKKNKSHDDSQIINNTGEGPNEVNLEVSLNSEKKKKKNKSHNGSQIIDNTGEGPNEVNLEVSLNSDKKKKKNKSHDGSQIIYNTSEEPNEVNLNVSSNSEKKKRKRNKKKNKSLDVSQGVQNTGEESDEGPVEVSYKSVKNDKSVISDPEPEVILTGSKNKFKKNKKKKKNSAQPHTDVNTINVQEGENSKKRKFDMTSALSTETPDDDIKMSKNQKKRKISQSNEAPTEEVAKNKSKKRKAQDDGQKVTKVFKENSLDKIHVPRLPESVINQLGDKPKESKKQKKAKVISTVPFEIEVGKNRKNKPSTYLEQSIYLNDSPVKAKPKASIKNPKVLPFVPTAITSGKGYTSNFKINVLSDETEFVAQPSDIANFKNEYLSKQRIKKLGTFERFKKQRNQKLAKF